MHQHKQNVMNSFRQGHIIEKYETLSQMNKDILNSDIELLELDVVNFVRFFWKLI